MSIRRHVRLRQEYLYRKSLEGAEKEQYEKKRVVKKALAEGKPLPTEVSNGKKHGLLNEVRVEDDFSAQQKTHIDDEYANAGVCDPKVCVTTSGDPSSRLKQFSKEVRLLFPNSQRLNRGGTKLVELVETCRSNDFTDIIIVHEHRGEPDSLTICHLPYGPTTIFSLKNCVMRHDIADSGTISEAYPHLIFNGFNTPLGSRAQNVLKFLFPVPKADSERIISFLNENDFISFRHHVFKRVGGELNATSKDLVELNEVGPRFEMQLYKIILGTADDKNAEIEWVKHSYTNTAKKRKVL